MLAPSTAFYPNKNAKKTYAVHKVVLGTLWPKAKTIPEFCSVVPSRTSEIPPFYLWSTLHYPISYLCRNRSRNIGFTERKIKVVISFVRVVIRADLIINPKSTRTYTISPRIKFITGFVLIIKTVWQAYNVIFLTSPYHSKKEDQEPKRRAHSRFSVFRKLDDSRGKIIKSFLRRYLFSSRLLLQSFCDIAYIANILWMELEGVFTSSKSHHLHTRAFKNMDL